MWFLGRRFKKSLIYILPILYIVEFVLIVQEANYNHEPAEGDTDSILGEELYMRILFDYLLYINVLAPSFYYALFIYVPGVFAAIGLAVI